MKIEKRPRVDRSLIIKVDPPKPIPSKLDDVHLPKKKKTHHISSTIKNVESHWSEWKNVFLIGTEWSIYDETYGFNWDFDHLFNKLKNGEFKGQCVHIFGSTEPQLVTVNGVETNLPIPHLVVVAGDYPAPAQIGICSVQRQNEVIVPFSDMKLSWTPFVSKSPELKNVTNVSFLHCYARKTLVTKMSEEDQKKFDYCLPYIFFPERKDDTEYPSDLVIQVTVGGRGVSFDFDYKSDEIDEIVKEVKEDNELTEDEAKVVENAIKSEIEATKEKYKKKKEEIAKKISAFTPQDKKAIAELKIYKFYPQNTDVDLSHLKSPFINRYYGKATQVL
jgi:hypothetical protein